MSAPSFALSVAIPTYRRPEPMARLLRSIIPQLSSEVEVVVRDDSPDNETEAIVRDLFRAREDQLLYSHGPKLGIDRGTLWTVEHARGKFVWTFGDDDEMVPDGIARVLEIVARYPDLGFVWTNVQTDGSTRPQVMLGEDRLFERPDDVLCALTNKMTLLSTFIINKEKAMPAFPLAEQYDGSMWSIMPLVYEAIATGPTYYVESPLVTNYLEAHGAADVLNGVQVFGINFANVLEEFRNRFSRRAIRSVLGASFGYVWRGFLVNRVRYGAVLPRAMRRDLIRIYWSYLGLWALLAGLLLPKSILASAYRGYHAFFSHRHFRFWHAGSPAPHRTP